MTSSIAFLKVLGATAAGLTTVGGIGYVSYHQLISTNNENNVSKKDSSLPEIYVIAESIDDNNKETQDFSNNTVEFDCSLSDSENTKTTCSIKELDFSTNNKKHMKLSELTTYVGKTTTKNKMQSANTFFKIEVSNELYSSLISENGFTKNIEVNLKTNPTSGKKLSLLKPLIAVKGTKVNAKTTYSLGKLTKFTHSTNTSTNEAGPITITGSTSPKCLFSNSVSAGIDCEIQSFATTTSSDHSNLSALTFDENGAKSSSLTKNNFYLFKYSGDAKDNSDFLSSQASSVTLNPQITVSGASNNVDKLEVSNLLPVIVAETKNAKKQFIFVLGN